MHHDHPVLLLLPVPPGAGRGSGAWWLISQESQLIQLGPQCVCTSHAHRNAHRHDTCCVCGRTRSPRPPPTRTRLHSQHTNTITMSLVSTPPHRTGRGIGPVSDMCSLVPPERAPVLSFSSWERPCEPTCVLSCLRNWHLSSPVRNRAFLVLVLSRIEMYRRGLLGPSAAPVGAQVRHPSHHRGRRCRVQLGRRD